MNALWVKLAKLLQGSGAQLPVLALGEDRLSIHTAGNSMPSLSALQLDPHRPGAQRRERARGKGWSEGAAVTVSSGEGKGKKNKRAISETEMLIAHKNVPLFIKRSNDLRPLCQTSGHYKNSAPRSNCQPFVVSFPHSSVLRLCVCVCDH